MLQNYDLVFFVVNIYREQSKIWPKNTSRIFNKQVKWNCSTSGKSEARKEKYVKLMMKLTTFQM